MSGIWNFISNLTSSCVQYAWLFITSERTVSVFSLLTTSALAHYQNQQQKTANKLAMLSNQYQTSAIELAIISNQLAKKAVKHDKAAEKAEKQRDKLNSDPNKIRFAFLGLMACGLVYTYFQNFQTQVTSTSEHRSIITDLYMLVLPFFFSLIFLMINHNRILTYYDEKERNNVFSSHDQGENKQPFRFIYFGKILLSSKEFLKLFWSGKVINFMFCSGFSIWISTFIVYYVTGTYTITINFNPKYVLYFLITTYLLIFSWVIFVICHDRHVLKIIDQNGYNSYENSTVIDITEDNGVAESKGSH